MLEMSYKTELPQAAVDLQPLSDHLGASVSDLISILQHTSHTQQQSTTRQHVQLLNLQPTPFPPSPSPHQQQLKAQNQNEALQDGAAAGCC